MAGPLGLVRVLCVCMCWGGAVTDVVTVRASSLALKEFHSVDSHFQLWVPAPDCAPVCEVTQSFPTFCDPLNCSPPGSSVLRIS